MDVLKNFLFPKIDFKRDIIRAKIWFPYGKRLLANNMTGQEDVGLLRNGKRAACNGRAREIAKHERSVRVARGVRL